jgi:hypothetical protein
MYGASFESAARFFWLGVKGLGNRNKITWQITMAHDISRIHDPLGSYLLLTKWSTTQRLTSSMVHVYGLRNTKHGWPG